MESSFPVLDRATYNIPCAKLAVEDLIRVTSTHNAHVTVHDTDAEQTNDSTQKTKGTNYKQAIAYI